MKNIALIWLLLASMSASKAQTPVDNISVAKAIFDAFNAHDWNGMMQYYAEDAVFMDPSFPEPVRDRDFMVRHHTELHQYFPDIHDEVKFIYGAGDTIIVEFVSTGTNQSGESFTLPICTVFTFEKGKVIRDATYYDVQP